MATRSELREKIMIIIYQVELYKNNKIEYNLDDIIKDNVDIENEFVKDMVYGTTTYVDKIDELANKHLNNWSIDRLDSMGRAILRMSIYEMLYMDTPDLVVINEAMELAKKYADDSVRKMINAVLDSLINEKDESSTVETEENNNEETTE
jgi:N utilization substance protein B